MGTAIDITEQEMLTQQWKRRQAHVTEAQKLTHTGSWAWGSPDRKSTPLCRLILTNVMVLIFGS